VVEADSEEAEGVAEEEGPGEVIWSLIIIINTGKRPKSLLRSYGVHVCMYSFFRATFAVRMQVQISYRFDEARLPSRIDGLCSSKSQT